MLRSINASSAVSMSSSVSKRSYAKAGGRSKHTMPPPGLDFMCMPAATSTVPNATTTNLQQKGYSSSEFEWRILFNMCTDCLLFDFFLLDHLQLKDMLNLQRTCRKWYKAVEIYVGSECFVQRFHIAGKQQQHKTDLVYEREEQQELLSDPKRPQQHHLAYQHGEERATSSWPSYRYIMPHIESIEIIEKPTARYNEGQNELRPELYDTKPYGQLFRALAMNHSGLARMKRVEHLRILPRLVTDLYAHQLGKIKTYWSVKSISSRDLRPSFIYSSVPTQQQQSEEEQDQIALDEENITVEMDVLDTTDDLDDDDEKEGGEQNHFGNGTLLAPIMLGPETSVIESLSSSSVAQTVLTTTSGNTIDQLQGQRCYLMDMAFVVKRIEHRFCIPFMTDAKRDDHPQRYDSIGYAVYYNTKDNQYWKRHVQLLRSKRRRHKSAKQLRLQPDVVTDTVYWETVVNRSSQQQQQQIQQQSQQQQQIQRPKYPLWFEHMGEYEYEMPLNLRHIRLEGVSLGPLMQMKSSMALKEQRKSFAFLMPGGRALSDKLETLSFVRCSRLDLTEEGFGRNFNNRIVDSPVLTLKQLLIDSCEDEKCWSGVLATTLFMQLHMPHLTHVIIRRSNHLLDTHVEEMLKELKELVYLDVTECSKLRGKFLMTRQDENYEILEQRLMASVMPLSSRRKRVLPPLSGEKITTLIMSGNTAIHEFLECDSQGGGIFWKHFPGRGLRQLVLRDFTAPKNQVRSPVFHMSTQLLRMIADQLATTLQMLDLSGCRHAISSPVLAPSTRYNNDHLLLLAPCRNLRSLKLLGCKDISDATIVVIAKQFPLLRELGIGPGVELTQQGIINGLVTYVGEDLYSKAHCNINNDKQQRYNMHHLERLFIGQQRQALVLHYDWQLLIEWLTLLPNLTSRAIKRVEFSDSEIRF